MTIVVGGVVPGLDPIVNNPTGDYQILTTDDYIITDGSNTITFPLFANATKPFFVVNEGITNDTLDGNGKTIPNSTLLTPTEVRGFIPGTSEWLEI